MDLEHAEDAPAAALWDSRRDGLKRMKKYR